MVRSVVSPALIAAGTLGATALILSWYRPPRNVGVSADTPAAIQQDLRDAGFDVMPVPDAWAAVATDGLPTATDGRTLWVLGIATEGLEVERVLRMSHQAPWWPDPPSRLPTYEEAQAMGQQVCPALAVFFVLYGVVFGLGSIARDADDGALAAELTLPIWRVVPPLARWVAATAVLTLFYALCVALVAAMVGVTDPGATVRNGAAACGGSAAIGIAVVGAHGLRAAFSGPFALGISGATAMLAVGATPAGPFLPVASVVAGGSGWIPMVVAGAAGVAASGAFAWRTRSG